MHLTVKKGNIILMIKPFKSSYMIQDKSSNQIPYIPNVHQKQLHNNRQPNMLIISARQNGTSVALGIDAIDKARTTPGQNIYFVRNSKEMIKTTIRLLVFIATTAEPKIEFSHDQNHLRFANGSRITVVRATCRVHPSEHIHVVNIEHTDIADENNVWYWTSARKTIYSPPDCTIITMLKPKSGSFAYRLALLAYKHKNDYTLQFTPWWMTLPTDIPEYAEKWKKREYEQRQSIEDYFDEVDIMTDVELMENDIAKEWYAHNLDILGWDAMKCEYPSYIEEVLFINRQK